MQIGEAAVYVIIAIVGIFLLINESFTDKVLNLMAGGFTTLNGVLGAIKVFKGRELKNFRWKFTLVLTIIELILGPIFIFAPTIDINGYIVMGALTSIAGTIEVISAFTMDNIKNTIKDGKDIARIVKDREE